MRGFEAWVIFSTPDRNRGIGQPRRHRETRMAKRDAAGCARAFHLGARDTAEPDGFADQPRQHLLAGEHPAHEVAEIKCADAFRLDAGIGECIARGKGGQIVDRRLVVAAEAGRSDSDNGYVSHHEDPPSAARSLLSRCLCPFTLRLKRQRAVVFTPVPYQAFGSSGNNCAPWNTANTSSRSGVM